MRLLAFIIETPTTNDGQIALDGRKQPGLSRVYGNETEKLVIKRASSGPCDLGTGFTKWQLAKLENHLCQHCASISRQTFDTFNEVMAPPFGRTNMVKKHRRRLRRKAASLKSKGIALGKCFPTESRQCQPNDETQPVIDDLSLPKATGEVPA